MRERIASKVTVQRISGKTRVTCTCGFTTSTGLGICRHIVCACDAIDTAMAEGVDPFLSVALIRSLVSPYWYADGSDYQLLTPQVNTNHSLTTYENQLISPKPVHDNDAYFAYIVNGISEGRAANGATPEWLTSELRKLAVVCFGTEDGNPFLFVGQPVDVRSAQEKRRINRLAPSHGPTSK
jgi:hypothetical protein